MGADLIDVDYGDQDPTLAATDPARDDLRLSLNAALAMPLDLVFSTVGLDDLSAPRWSFETFVRYDTTWSNIDVYDSSNLTIGLSFSRSFGG